MEKSIHSGLGVASPSDSRPYAPSGICRHCTCYVHALDSCNHIRALDIHLWVLRDRKCDCRDLYNPLRSLLVGSKPSMVHFFLSLLFELFTYPSNPCVFVPSARTTHGTSFGER